MDLYLYSVTLPTLEQEARRYECHAYPYGIFPFRGLHFIEFSNLTIFYGGNGSGKTTLLNIIAEGLKLPRITPFNTSPDFSDFVKTGCEFDIYDGIKNGAVPEGSAIFTSDDVFYKIIDRRYLNEEIDSNRGEAWEEFMGYKSHGTSSEKYIYNSIDDYDGLVRKLALKKSKSAREYMRRVAGERITTDSNGQYALDFWNENLRDNRLYLLDEPENSLSIKYQMKLAKLLEESIRFFGCQIVISTHSPVFLSMKNALIYDLDENPVKTKAWWELENMRLYYKLFAEYRDKFEK